MSQQHRLPLFRGLPHSYWYLWGGTLINRLGSFVIPFLTIYLTVVRGLEVEQAAFIVSLFGLGAFVASFCGGLLADHIGRRTTMVGSQLLTALSILLLGIAQSPTPIAILTLLLGLCSNIYRPASSAAIADMTSPSQRVQAYGLMYWAINIGASVGPVLAGFFMHVSYWLLFSIDALTTFFFGILIWWKVPETRPEPVSHSKREQLEQRSGFRVALSDPLLLGYCLLVCLFACIYMQYQVTLPIDMKLHGLDETQYGLAIALNGLIIVFCSVPLNPLLARWPRYVVLPLAAVLLGVGFGLNSFVHILPWYMVAIVIWTFGELIASPVSSAVIADLSPSTMRGVYQGVLSMAWGLAGFIGPLLGGFIFGRFGAQVLWIGCFILGICVAIGQFFLSRWSSSRHTEQEILSVSSPVESREKVALHAEGALNNE